MKQGKILLVAAALTAAFMLVMNGVSRADNVPIECPAGAVSCRVVIMTPDEINTLTGTGLIFDSAEWANRANLSAAIAAWRNKINTAPNGNGKKDEPSKKQDRPPQEAPKK